MRRHRLSALEAEAFVRSGRRIDQIIWSELGNHEWAQVTSGCCVTVRGEILIADLLWAGRRANTWIDYAGEANTWALSWCEEDGHWSARGEHFPGMPYVSGGAWWSDDVCYRRDYFTTPCLRGHDHG